MVGVSNRRTAPIEGGTNAGELSAESVLEPLVLQGHGHKLAKLRVGRGRPAREHVEDWRPESDPDGPETLPDSLDEGLASGVTSRGSWSVARSLEGFVQPQCDGRRVVQSPQPRLASERANDGGRMKVAVHPRRDLGQQPITGARTDPSQGLDDGVPNSKAQVVGVHVELRHEPCARRFVIGRSGSEGQDSADREKLEGGGSRGFFFVEPREREGHVVCPCATRPALLRERIGERVVRARPRKPRAPCEKGFEGRGATGDRLVESAAERAGSRLEHASAA